MRPAVRLGIDRAIPFEVDINASSSHSDFAGACRASLATFPAVCRGLWRLGVDDATLRALMCHDVRQTAATEDTEGV